MRHSRAVPADFQTTDEARWLSESGRELALAAGQALAQEGGVECIVTSPLVRAVQTAEIVAQCLGYTGPIRTFSSLRSEMAPARAIEDLQALASRSVLALSHEPIVSGIAGLLREKSGSDFVSGFRPAEIRGFRGSQQVFRHLG